MSLKQNVGAVFVGSVLVVGAFVAWGILDPTSLGVESNRALDFTSHTFGWFYLIGAAIFLGFSIYLLFSRFGDVRLGKDAERPKYSYFTWLAMLFSAGMGIGLVFFGVAEPLGFFTNPPLGQAEPGTPEAARLAMRYSFFHWGLHPWAIYTVMGLTIAYWQFRHEAEGLISSAFRPLIGDRVNGPIGQSIDGFAAVATAAGVATTLGLGTMQINGGLNFLFGTEDSRTMQLMIIGVLTALYLISTTTGLDRGIRILSLVNMTVAGSLLLFVIIFGPTRFIFESFTTTIGGYLGNLIPMSFRLSPFSGGEWVFGHTLFYWAWWIAWAPFVGTFIARVSRGRTIREFVSGVLIVPTLLGCLWFAAFGGAGLYGDLFMGTDLAGDVAVDHTQALFHMLASFPFGYVLAALAVCLIITFFVTSADSATFVLGMLTTNGNLNPQTWVRVVWGLLQSGIAAALLFSGGLLALQTASIVAALPFAIIMVGMVWALHKALCAEFPRPPLKPAARSPSHAD